MGATLASAPRAVNGPLNSPAAPPMSHNSDSNGRLEDPALVAPLLVLVGLGCPAVAGAVSLPVKVSDPTLSGSSTGAGYARAGDTLICSPGTWTGDGIS